MNMIEGSIGEVLERKCKQLTLRTASPLRARSVAKLTPDSGRGSDGGYDLLPIRYSLEYVLRIRLESAMAGVAMHISPRLFLPSTLNSGPAWMT